jgi:hypothetical protein
MAGYIRADTGNNIANGNFVDATYLDQEFDAIVAAFHASTGHNHSGSAANGAPVTVLGPAQDFIASATELKPKTTDVYDLGITGTRFKNLWLSGNAAVTGNGTFGGTLGVTGAATIGGTLGVTGTITATSLVGNASTATQLLTGRTIAISTGATGTATSFNGASNITIPVTALDATYLTAGTIPVGRLPTGATSGMTTWFRNLATDSAAYNQHGNYVFLKNDGGSTITPGDIVNTNTTNLRYSDSTASSGSLLTSGLYMAMGRAVAGAATLFFYIG